MTSQRDSNSSGPERTITLNIRTEAEKREMMREMLVEFVRVVDPREDGLLDSLYASYMLTETDNESLSGKDVLNRKDQARKLWFILNQVQLEDFMSSVAPELCKMYPHIIPSRFVAHAGLNVTPEPTGDDSQKTKCLRHAIQGRIRATSMADMLYSRNFLDLENYGGIISGNYEADRMWESIFSTFSERTESEVLTLTDGLREILHHHHMIPADSLKDILTLGLPCMCESHVSSPLVTASGPKTKVLSWLLNTNFSLTRSSATSKTNMPASTYSSCATQNSASSHASSCPDAGNVCETTVAPDDKVITITATPSADANHETAVVNTAKNTLCDKIKSISLWNLFTFLFGIMFVICYFYMADNEERDQTVIKKHVSSLYENLSSLANIHKDHTTYTSNVLNELIVRHNELASYVYRPKG